jgi:hypothetical protein
MALNPNNARPVRIVDESGNIISSFGGSSSLAAAGKQTAISKSDAGASNIAAANPNRTELSFTNNHATVAVRVKEGGDAAAASGIRLLPGGTFWASTKDRVSVCPESGNADCFGYEVVA